MPFAGTEEFLSQLLARRFLSSRSVTNEMDGWNVNGHFFQENGFELPVLIRDKKGLRIRVPETPFTLKDVIKYTAPDFPIEVINVQAQDTFTVELSDFVRRFNAPHRKETLNVLSFEFSDTELADMIQPPCVVGELSLVDTCWPNNNNSHSPIATATTTTTASTSSNSRRRVEDNGDTGSETCSKPTVQKYCLMSMGGSYTDFHIDFSGSAVWYHILWGQKIFYLIPPTQENLDIYWEWLVSPNNEEVFLPDLLKKTRTLRARPEDGEDEMVQVPSVYRMSLTAGQTVLLPSGWIHAVYTPKDSLVFGGNFLTKLGVPFQLSVYRMEQKVQTMSKFIFPYFEKLHWYLAEHLVDRFSALMSNKQHPRDQELTASICLVHALRDWYAKRINMEESERDNYLPSKDDLGQSHKNLMHQLEAMALRFSRKQPSTPTKQVSSGKPSPGKPLSIPYHHTSPEQKVPVLKFPRSGQGIAAQMQPSNGDDHGKAVKRSEQGADLPASPSKKSKFANIIGLPPVKSRGNVVATVDGKPVRRRGRGRPRKRHSADDEEFDGSSNDSLSNAPSTSTQDTYFCATDDDLTDEATEDNHPHHEPKHRLKFTHTEPQQKVVKHSTRTVRPNMHYIDNTIDPDRISDYEDGLEDEDLMVRSKDIGNMYIASVTADLSNGDVEYTPPTYSKDDDFTWDVSRSLHGNSSKRKPGTKTPKNKSSAKTPTGRIPKGGSTKQRLAKRLGIK